jgi:predicted  nucleic acid-binding Zn-ribbon protein
VSIAEHIIQLERLAAIDGQIKELTEGIDKERGELSGVRTELAELEQRVKADSTSVNEMEKTRADLVQELRQISSQIERSRERLQRSRNEREVNAAERELDELRKIQRDRDDEIKKLTELTDQARISINDGEKRKDDLGSRLEGTLEGANRSISGLEAELEAKQKERELLAVKLPSIVRRRYQRLHERGKVPIAKTHDGTCLGCFVQLPPMLFHTMLSQQEFDECPNCHRIIYYQPKPTDEEEQNEENEGASEADQAGEATH